MASSFQTFSDVSAVRKPTDNDYSWQTVSAVLIKYLPSHLTMKNLFHKDLTRFHRTVATLGMYSSCKGLPHKVIRLSHIIKNHSLIKVIS